MSELLCLRLVTEEYSNCGNEEFAVEWAVFSKDHQLIGGSQVQPLSQITEALEDIENLDIFRAVVIVPGEYVLSTEASVPTTNKRQIMQALPYMIEEQLCEEVEEVHLSIGDRNAQGKIPVLVVKQRLMEYWLKILKDVGITPDLVIPDYLCVPLYPSHISLSIDGERVFLKTSVQGGFTTEQNLVNSLLETVIEPLDYYPKLLIQHQENDDLLMNSVESSFDDLEITKISLPESTFLAMANYAIVHSEDLGCINLLQGNYAVDQYAVHRAIRWQPLAKIAAICFVLKISMDVALGAFYQHQAEAMNMQSMTLYKELFPKDRKVSYKTMGKRFKNHVRSISNTSSSVDFFTLLNISIESLKEVAPGARFNTLAYDEKNSILKFNIIIADAIKLDEFKKKIKAGGYSVKNSTTNYLDDNITTNITIKKSNT